MSFSSGLKCLMPKTHWVEYYMIHFLCWQGDSGPGARRVLPRQQECEVTLHSPDDLLCHPLAVQRCGRDHQCPAHSAWPAAGRSGECPRGEGKAGSRPECAPAGQSLQIIIIIIHHPRLADAISGIIADAEAEWHEHCVIMGWCGAFRRLL